MKLINIYLENYYFLYIEERAKPDKTESSCQERKTGLLVHEIANGFTRFDNTHTQFNKDLRKW